MSDPQSDRRSIASTYRCYYDVTQADLSTTVVEAVAEAKGVATADLSEPLAEYVDPDGLDHLFRARANGEPRSTDGSLTFRFEGCLVRVDADGSVEVTETA